MDENSNPLGSSKLFARFSIWKYARPSIILLALVHPGLSRTFSKSEGETQFLNVQGFSSRTVGGYAHGGNFQLATGPSLANDVFHITFSQPIPFLGFIGS